MTTMAQISSELAQKTAKRGNFMRHEGSEPPEMARWRWRHG